jgi:hypothetical protein
LKKVSDTILSRAQKGFTNSKVLQECLINICETVAHCNSSKTEGFMLAIDQAKAFDTVSHKFILEVYKFFGFGERFIDLLKITTMGRNACILLEGGKLSKSFPLKTGFTQGNAPSPLQFNFCEQIFIFKLEYCSQIRSIIWHNKSLASQDWQVAAQNRQLPRQLPCEPPSRGSASR